jgi:hypothetical protein
MSEFELRPICVHRVPRTFIHPWFQSLSQSCPRGPSGAWNIAVIASHTCRRSPRRRSISLNQNLGRPSEHRHSGVLPSIRRCRRTWPASPCALRLVLLSAPRAMALRREGPRQVREPLARSPTHRAQRLPRQPARKAGRGAGPFSSDTDRVTIEDR